MSKSSEAEVRAVFVAQSSADAAADQLLTQAALRRLDRVFPGVPIYSNGPLHNASQLDGDVYSCLRQIRSRCLSSDQDSVALCTDLFPMLDANLFEEVRQRHFRYLAQYSFAENTPPGLAPDLLSSEFIALLPPEPKTAPRDYVLANINEIDVELIYRLPDLRQYRMDLTTATARSRRLAHGLLRAKPDATFSDLETLIAAHPELLRPFPSYFEVELTSRSPATPIYGPAPRRARTQVDLADTVLEALFAEIEDEGLAGDATICFGGQGDPLLRPDWQKWVRRALTCGGVREVFVETYGTTLDSSVARELSAATGVDRLRFIVRLPSLKNDRSLRLLGADILPGVMRNLAGIEALSEAQRPFQLYAEMLKIRDADDEIQAFFDRFEPSPCVRPLLNKFNSYIGRVEERRVSDLTPLVRDYCRHLARDLYVTAEGRIPLCKQDPFGEGPFGLPGGPGCVRAFLQATAGHHAASMRGDHAEIPMNCEGCDEWFTWNA